MTPMVLYDPILLRHLIDYVIAADRAGMEAADGLTDEEYYKDRGFSFGSIHNLLVHQMVSQETWFERWKGLPRTGRLENENEYPTRQRMKEHWATVHENLVAFLATQTTESINGPMEVRRNNGELITLPLGAMVMHVADHGTYHRGQLASMLKLAGAKPPYAPYFRFAYELGKPS